MTIPEQDTTPLSGFSSIVVTSVGRNLNRRLWDERDPKTKDGEVDMEESEEPSEESKKDFNFTSTKG